MKATYHRLVPPTIRYPIGAARRRLDDLYLRWQTELPLPPGELLEAVQMTPRLREYLDVGQRASAGLSGPLEARGFGRERELDVLDFGCGLGRTLRFFTGTSWRLAGCDVDRRLIDWCQGSLPGVDWRTNEQEPPLPFPEASFDILWSVSVFTHFADPEQAIWAEEIARVLRPGGLALISLMGPHAMGAFPALQAEGLETLRRDGFFFQRGGDAFNERGAFHTDAGVKRIFSPFFRLDQWLEGGLDGFQDLAMLIRC